MTIIQQKPNIHKGIDQKKRAALAYAKLLNWSVFPVHSIENGKCTCGSINCAIGKHPRTSNGVHAATTDLEQIEAWWDRWPNSNIGIATGKVSGFFVLDVDVGEINGKDTLDDLVSKHGPLPETVQSITGSLGLHYFYKYQEGIGNKTNLFPSCDIRGDGGYIIASPSVHISGRNYEFELMSRPVENEIAEAPQWILDAIIQPREEKPKPKPSTYWQKMMNGIEEGGRNSAAASLAGHLFRRYVDPLLVVEIVKAWNFKNNPPMEERELETILDSVAKIELRRREGV